MLISPIMTAAFTYVSPAGLGLYFFVGGIVACIQTLIVNAMRPQIRKRVQAQMAEVKKKNAIAAAAAARQAKAAGTDHNNQPKVSQAKAMHANNRKRNAGKQHRNK